MFAMAKVAGCIARSKEEIKACNMVFYFLVGNVFFFSVLSGSLLDIIGQFISNPKIIPSQLARAVSAQVCCFHFCYSINDWGTISRIILCTLQWICLMCLYLNNLLMILTSILLFQADFFVTYILTDGLSGFSLEVLQPGLLIWHALKSCTPSSQRERSPYLYSLPYFRIIPFVSLSVLIGIVYAVVAPLLLPFLIIYFCLGYVVYINQVGS